LRILANVSLWIVFLPLAISILRLFKLSRDSLLIVGIVAFAAVPQLFKATRICLNSLDLIYNLYSLIEIIFFFVLLFRKIKTPAFRSVFLFSFSGYCSASIIIFIQCGAGVRFYNELVCANNIIYCTWILLLILEQYKEDAFVLDYRNSLYWYISGLFLYAPCTVLIFSFWHYIKSNPESYLIHLKLIHHVFNILMYLFFSVGIFFDTRKKI